VGHQTGLFETLAGLRPSTSQEIASAAGLHERYVREWLAGMVTGGIIEYDPLLKTYALPAEHAAMLTRAAGPNNLAVLAPFVSQYGAIEQGVISSFRNGGGVPYNAAPHIQHLQDDLNRAVYDATLISTTLPLVPGLVDKLRAGIEALDIGCGEGHVLNLMAQAFPNSRFRGYDFQEDGIAAAQAEARALGLTNVRFEVKDVASLDTPGSYDLVTAFDVIHDLAHPRPVLSAIHRALKPGGTLLMVDIAASSNLEDNLEHPIAPALYTVSLFHCMTVSLAQGGEGLGTMWGEQKARELLAESGFTRVDVQQVPGDFQNNYYIAGK
jgi:2-polyprenyl-3-methyl-5-hydroxy-6-metoxy-1,4-benzoquinol methylase